MSREKNEDLASCLEKWLAEDEAMRKELEAARSLLREVDRLRAGMALAKKWLTLDELAALEKAASLGPWEFRATKDSGGIQFVVAPNAPRNAKGFEFIAADCSHGFNGEFIAAMRNHARVLIDVARAAKVYLDAFDGDNGPSIFEHESREALRLKLKELE